MGLLAQLFQKSTPKAAPSRPDRRSEHFRQLSKESRAPAGELADIRRLGNDSINPSANFAVLYDYYHRVWVVRAVVDKIVTEATREGYEWADGPEADAKTTEEPANVAAFLAACNPLYSFKDLVKATVGALEIVDNAYVSIVTGDGDVPVELWFEDPRFVRLRIDKKGRLRSKELFCPGCYEKQSGDQYWEEGYYKEGGACPNACGALLKRTAYISLDPQQPLGGKDKIVSRWARDEMLHFVKYSGATRLYGRPKTVAVATLAATLNYMEHWQLNAYADSKSPDGFLVFPGMTPAQGKEMINDFLETKRKNPTARHLIPLFKSSDQKPEFVKTMDSLVEMNAIEYMMYVREAVAACFGVSLKSLGIETPGKMGATKSEGETDQIEVTNNTIEESQAQVAETLNRFFRERFKTTVYWRLKSPRKDDARRKADIIMTNANSAKTLKDLGFGVKLLDDGLHLEITEEPIEEPKPKPQPFGAPPRPAMQEIMQPDGGTDIEKSLDPRNLPPGEAPSGISALEDEFAEDATNAYLKEFNAAVAAIPEGATKAEIEVILDRAAERLTRRLETLAVRYAGDVAALSFEAEGSAFSQVDLNAIEVLAARPDAFFAAIRTFPQEAVASLKEIVAARYAQPGGLDLRAMVTEMNAAVGGGTYQLERIARTETTRIANAGREMAWRKRPEFDASERTYEWVVADDERLEDECRSIAARNPWTLDELRAATSKFGEWLVHPNCRCTAVRNPQHLLDEED